MNRLKTIKYISETSVDDMISDIKNKNMDVNYVIAASLEARKEFGLKVGLFIDEASKLLQKLEVGMLLEAKEECMNNFRKGQRVELTNKIDKGFLVNDAVVLDEKTINSFFNIVGQRK